MSATERILALDPGERVGWAAGTWEDGVGLTDLSQGVAALKDMALAMAKRIDTYDTVVYETWRLYPEKAKKMVGNDFQPAQFIGMVRLLAWLHPSIKLVSQGANLKETAMQTMPAALKQRFKRSSEQHDRDALMHLHYYVWRTRVDGPNQPTYTAS